LTQLKLFRLTGKYGIQRELTLTTEVV